MLSGHRHLYLCFQFIQMISTSTRNRFRRHFETIRNIMHYHHIWLEKKKQSSFFFAEIHYLLFFGLSFGFSASFNVTAVVTDWSVELGMGTPSSSWWKERLDLDFLPRRKWRDSSWSPFLASKKPLPPATVAAIMAAANAPDLGWVGAECFRGALAFFFLVSVEWLGRGVLLPSVEWTELVEAWSAKTSEFDRTGSGVDLMIVLTWWLFLFLLTAADRLWMISYVIWRGAG